MQWKAGRILWTLEISMESMKRASRQITKLLKVGIDLPERLPSINQPMTSADKDVEKKEP